MGKGVGIDAAELNIESLQDTTKYDSKQKDMSAQVTVGSGASASGSYSQSKMNADYAAVTEQSGIMASDDGYHINVKGNTDLKGAIITSTQAAEDAGKNKLSTGSLTYSDIKNHADYEGSSFGISASDSVSGSSMGQNPNKHLTDQGKNGTSKSIGYGSDSDHQSSTTASSINTANITITDEAKQQQLTGKTAQETIADIHTNVTTDTQVSNAGSLKNNFDKDTVQKELDLQREVTQEFDQNRQEVKKTIYNYADSKRKQAEEIRKNNYIDGKNSYNTAESLALEASANQWEKAALYTDLLLGAIYGAGNSDALAYVGSAAAIDPVHRVVTAPKQIWAVKCKQDGLYCSNYSYDGKILRPVAGEFAEIGDKRQIFDMDDIKPGETTGVVTISDNGILNPLNDALKNATKQNLWSTNTDGVRG